ncbi:MAG: flagellar basal body L-ring protein FlgH [Synergistales bacterium]|nr:flagellar basal body L-ring protein FlgH [Synergistales bacterium]
MLRKTVALALFLLLCAVPAGAQSLWEDGSSLYSDPKPDQVGDIVTVVVEEETSTEDEAVTELDKQHNTQVSDGTGILDFIKELGVAAGITTQNEGTTERTHSIETTISCLVTEVLPNGNLVIEGIRDLQTHEETLKLRFRGVVRPRDINTDNQVQSIRVANAELSVDGRGSISNAQKPGLISQILGVLF